MPYVNLPFFIHILGEFGASCGFWFRPSATLDRPQPDAHPIIRQYALLLVSTNLIAGIFLFQDQPSKISCQVAGALAFYHLGPLTRAALKVRDGQQIGFREGMGGTWIHLAFHSIATAGLIWEATKSL